MRSVFRLSSVISTPNDPTVWALALDLMEEFRPWLADRLAVTLINRKQIGRTFQDPGWRNRQNENRTSWR